MFLIDFFDRFKNLKVEENAHKPFTKVKTNLMDFDLTSDDNDIDSHPTSVQNSSSVSSKPPSLYIKSFVFSPDVPIRLDYHGKRVDFEQVKKFFLFKYSLNLIDTLKYFFIGCTSRSFDGPCTFKSK